MAGHTYVNEGTAAAGNGTTVDIKGDANFTAKQLLLINDNATLTITVAGLGTVNSLSLGPKEAIRIAGRFTTLRMVEATATATFRVVASDSVTPEFTIANIS
jgi:hypothetical protein